MEQARAWLKEASRVAVLTGAGISAESGIPTWRGPEGLWKNHRPEQLACEKGFARDPKLVWEWYDWRRGIAAAAQPNAAHLALVELEQRYSAFTLATQNTDGLHERAGSKKLLRLHGSIWTLRCRECGREVFDQRTPLPDMPPHCECGGLQRPGVVWFGEALPEGVFEQAEKAATACDVLLVVGTSAVVYPAALLIPLARQSGARVIEINTEPTAFSGRTAHSLRGPAGAILPALVQ